MIDWCRASLQALSNCAQDRVEEDNMRRVRLQQVLSPSDSDDDDDNV